MLIAYGSDFHFEFYSAERAFRIIDDWEFHPDTFCLIIAGDLHVGAKRVINTLEYISKTHNIHVIYVPGNHEYYNSTFTKENGIFMDNGLNHVWYTILMGTSCVFEDVMFVGAMGNIDGSYESINRGIHGALNDFHVIGDFNDHAKYGLREHDYIARELRSHNHIHSKIVITHTMPSPRCIADKYKGSYLNACFTNDWEDIIVDYKPGQWICGHTHEVGNVLIDKTNVLINPMGYPRENKVWEWRYFNV